MKLSYKDAGVDISEGNRAVELMKKAVASTYDDGVLGDIGLFSGGYDLSAAKEMDEPVLLGATDGVGTKLLVAQMMDVHDTVGIDLVAMSVNDLICQGAKPLFFLDYVATGHVSAEKMQKIVEGVAQGCRESGCALIGGETAEMPGLYGEDEYDLAGFAVGLCDKKNMIDGSRVAKGDAVIGLHSNGFHSNGYSLARKFFFDHKGFDVDSRIEELDGTVGEALLRPTKLYVKTVLALKDRFDVRGISNITGGGLIENVPRILPEDLDCVVQKGSWEMPDVFRYIESEGVIDEEELYRSFNMGVGMVLIVPADEADDVMAFIAEETDDEASVIGSIEPGTGVVQFK
ncbi:MAG: phosphoribosylformylglycinamidine cyclo-ligase [Peptoniphilus sp.]|nr:phosphoribosylformylglycinamidine cyclo-ligase [Peptoniphilus sp.]MDY6045232.1 phosphoribosylformylglycinamidine cyclo-ligase [Peptoniphilus sp.]